MTSENFDSSTDMLFQWALLPSAFFIPFQLMKGFCNTLPGYLRLTPGSLEYLIDLWGVDSREVASICQGFLVVRTRQWLLSLPF